jgi:hypothetical protein
MLRTPDVGIWQCQNDCYPAFADRQLQSTRPGRRPVERFEATGTDNDREYLAHDKKGNDRGYRISDNTYKSAKIALSSTL